MHNHASPGGKGKLLNVVCSDQATSGNDMNEPWHFDTFVL